MKKKSPIDLVILDFLKYIPKPKRNDYELILRRCNFSDVSDPLFPVMLFLLFLQDNLADGTENLAVEILELKNKLQSERLPESPRKSLRWKFISGGMLAIQLILSLFCLFKLNGIPAHSIHPGIYENSPYPTEIQKMNFYWDMKLEQIKNERYENMNNLLSESNLYIMLLIAVMVLMVILLIDIIIFISIARIIRLDKKKSEANENLRHNFKELCAVKEGENLLEALQLSQGTDDLSIESTDDNGNDGRS